MSALADDERTLMQRYSSLGFSGANLSQTLKPHPGIAEAVRIDGDEITNDAPDGEPTRVAADLSSLSLALDVAERVGRGGMADVRAATQKALRRSVALKSLRKDQVNPANARQLLQEARIQGALEHPAIVPVYMLATDSGGNPVIVMRHVVGRLWRDYIDEFGTRTLPPGVDRDPLEYHVGVLMQICSAVHLAHTRGVLHRDLKLRNVMIGPLGEPYLIDWGLACALDEESELDLPWVRSEEKLRGTPGYMAPEMAAVEPENIGVRTDVYLLGGCLHAVLTGWPRHGGRTVIEQLASAYSSRPVKFEDHVPPGLAAIVNKATAREPADRYASAQALRKALGDWLDARQAQLVAAKTEQRVRAEERAWAEEEIAAIQAERRDGQFALPMWLAAAVGLALVGLTVLLGLAGAVPGGSTGLGLILAGELLGMGLVLGTSLALVDDDE
jgi:serine/threonine-protein kinase